MKPHGLRGEVVVELVTDRTERLQPGSRLFVGADAVADADDGADGRPAIRLGAFLAHARRRFFPRDTGRFAGHSMVPRQSLAQQRQA